jgi:hypothetical protein
MSPVSEIIFLDGPEDPEFVVVFDADDVHYFYWPYEWTISKKLPKASDVEPVKIRENVVLSRFHYFGMTIWINPKKDGELPIVSFTRNMHSPIAIHNNDIKIEMVPLENYDTIPWYEKPGYWIGKEYFKNQIKDTKLNSPREYYSKIVIPQGDVFEEKILFDKNSVLKFIKELIIIGTDKDISDFISKIKGKNSQKLTADLVADYFGFT